MITTLCHDKELETGRRCSRAPAAPASAVAPVLVNNVTGTGPARPSPAPATRQLSSSSTTATQLETVAKIVLLGPCM